MSNFLTLYRYELKKNLKRKITWITLAVCLVAISISALSDLLGSYYVEGKLIDSHYHMFQVDSNYCKALSGRKLDQELFEEMAEGYRKIPANVEMYTTTEEYQTYARPYSPVFNFLRSSTGMKVQDIMNWKADEGEVYSKRLKGLEEMWQEQNLSEGEKEYWRQKEAEISKPLVYYYHEGYETGIKMITTVGVLMLLFVAVSLSGIFTEDHVRRTDQMILCSAEGRSTAYWARISAGITLSLAGSFIMVAFTMIISLAVYGFNGFNAMLQISNFSSYSYPLTVGEAVLIAYGILIITSVIAGVFVMALSELLHSSIATLAVSAALIILPMMVSIPPQYDVISQLWKCSPTAFLTPWNIFDIQLIPLFGDYFTPWQIVPVVYILLSIGLSMVSLPVYRRYQVSGR